MIRELKYKTLIVSSNEKFSLSLKKMFNLVQDMVDFVDSASLARRLLQERDYEIVIINSLLKDEDGVLLSLDASMLDKGVILFTPASNYHEAYDKTNSYGILVLAKPTPTEMFVETLRLLESSRKRLEKKALNSMSFKDKLEEIRIINEAKLLLIKNLKYSEEMAHKYIEKQAMDLRITKKRSSELVINKYRN